jgi:hypothetical protein
MLERVYRALALQRVDQIRYNIKMDLKEMGFEGIAGFMWLMIDASGGLLRTW